MDPDERRLRDLRDRHQWMVQLIRQAHHVNPIQDVGTVAAILLLAASIEKAQEDRAESFDIGATLVNLTEPPA